jgi:hypothetical protein
VWQKFTKKISTRLHGATTQKTAIFVSTAARTSNPTGVYLVKNPRLSWPGCQQVFIYGQYMVMSPYPGYWGSGQWRLDSRGEGNSSRGQTTQNYRFWLFMLGEATFSTFMQELPTAHTVMFADDQTIFAQTESELQLATQLGLPRKIPNKI